MKRVAYVCADAGVPILGHKGCSIHVQEVSRTLVARGARLDYHTLRPGKGTPPSWMEHTRTFRVPLESTDEPAQRETARIAAAAAVGDSLASAGPYDLVYERQSLWSSAGMEYAQRTGVPGILEVNAPLIEEQEAHRSLGDRETAERVLRRTLDAASLVVAVSDAVAGYLAERGCDPDKLAVVPNGVNPARFAVCEPGQRRADEPFTVGFLGSLKPWHGIGVLLDAFARLHARCPNARLLVIGAGPEGQRIAREAADQKLSDAVHLTGAVARNEVPGWLERADVGVAPYPQTEGFYFSPLKVLEYMAAGLPVVASRVGVLREWIEEGRNGILCEPDEPAALAESLEALLRAPERCREFGSNGRQQVAEHHSWETVVSRILTRAGIDASLH